jgi:UDPglucose 6-dehydrogenase
MEVSVFGSGYVGLVQAAVLADVGHQVICVDVDPQKIAQLQRGIPPIHEPGLSAMLEENLKAKRLHFTSQASDAVAHGKLIFIAVGTPPNEDGAECRPPDRQPDGARLHARNQVHSTGRHG